MQSSKHEIRKLQIADELIFYYLSIDKYIGGHIVLNGSYEPFEMHILLSLLNEGDIAVDIGANIGVYTLTMTKRVGTTGKVYAFEPEPVNFELLTKNIKENNLTNVICSEFAISNTATLTSLFLSEENFGDHRLYQDNTDRKVISVITDSLDNLLINKYKEGGSIKLIKIDTQGFEPFVIEGAKQIIQEHLPAIFLEYWPDGFKNASADHSAMMDFLIRVYGKFYLIDEDHKRIFTTTRDFIDKYCDEHVTSYCNIAFFGPNAIMRLKDLASRTTLAS